MAKKSAKTDRQAVIDQIRSKQKRGERRSGLMIVGVAVSAIPAALLMSRFGRKRCFLASAVSASGAGLLAAYAISIEAFWLFCAATFLIGSNNDFDELKNSTNKSPAQKPEGWGKLIFFALDE